MAIYFAHRSNIAATVALRRAWHRTRVLNSRRAWAPRSLCVWATRTMASATGAPCDLPSEDATSSRDGLAPWVPSAGVSIPRPDELRRKLEGFSVGDTHVVVDFDFTLTRYWLPGGGKGLSSHLLVQRCARLHPFSQRPSSVGSALDEHLLRLGVEMPWICVHSSCSIGHLTA